MTRVSERLLRNLPSHVRVEAAIEQLEPGDRHVLAMLLLERLTPLEAAGTLGTTVAEVERRYAAAMESVAANVATRSGRRRRAA